MFSEISVPVRRDPPNIIAYHPILVEHASCSHRPCDCNYDDKANHAAEADEHGGFGRLQGRPNFWTLRLKKLISRTRGGFIFWGYLSTPALWKNRGSKEYPNARRPSILPQF
jgi:hypothetical protein